MVCGYTVVFFLPLSYRHIDTENRMNYCIAVGKHRIRITERDERGLSVLHASSVTMGTASVHLSFCFLLSSLILSPLAGRKLCTATGMRRKAKWHFACLPPALFYPMSNTHFTLVFLCSCVCRAFSTVVFFFVFFLHLAGVPQGAVTLCGCGQNKKNNNQALNHHSILVYGVALTHFRLRGSSKQISPNGHSTKWFTLVIQPADSAWKVKLTSIWISESDYFKRVAPYTNLQPEAVSLTPNTLLLLVGCLSQFHYLKLSFVYLMRVKSLH